MRWDAARRTRSRCPREAGMAGPSTPQSRSAMMSRPCPREIVAATAPAMETSSHTPYGPAPSVMHLDTSDSSRSRLRVTLSREVCGGLARQHASNLHNHMGTE